MAQDLTPAAAVAEVGQYDEAELLRIVRAAIAFRKAAPQHSWPHAPWAEMAELCAAVDRKPGPEPVVPAGRRRWQR